MEKYIDIHIHPALKTYSKSFSKNKVNSRNPNHKHSVWNYNPPTLLDKGLNYFGTITKFSQSDFTSLARGNFGVVFISLYTVERGFLVPKKLNKGLASDIIANFVMEIGKARIDFIQARKDYFADVEGEYEYYRQLDGVKFKINRDDQFQYRLVKSFGEIQENEASAENIISVVVTIEGGHAFDTGLGKDNAPESKVLANVKKAKNWDHPPFFVTLAHHFYNDLVGHCSSLAPILTGLLDQKKGIGEGFTDLGWKVLDLLLDEKQGKRVYADIKHLSPLARKQYFNHLDTKYKGQDIPIIISHGAVNGLHSVDDPVVKIPSSHGMFNSGDINFYDVEFLELARRGGLIGIQMDERRLGDEALIKQMNGKVFRRKILFHRSQLFWNQVRHIAEVLDGAGYFGWGIQSLGTDFDGVVDPLNGYWTSEDLTYLDDYLLKHAYNYMNADGKNLKEASNRKIDPEEIVSRVMTDNAYAFLKKYFV